MQPLLLLKQTLEASYDPGPLLLDGPNVKFTSTDQLFSRMGEGKQAKTFQAGIDLGIEASVTIRFSRRANRGIKIQHVTEVEQGEAIRLTPGIIPSKALGRSDSNLFVERNRCFLELRMRGKKEEEDFVIGSPSPVISLVSQALIHIIHLPGLRGNPERAYPVTAVGPTFPGTFENYAASVVANWQTEKKNDKLRELGKNFERLGLTWKVTAKPINDTQVEIHVGRLPRSAKGGAHDLVSIADVGIGISQTLPVLVALLTAEPGQLVYLEQPELHLHPRAQTAMAYALADAAKRGVRVVAETHSSLLLLGIQTLVAESQLSPDIIKLHWFRRNENGATEIESADLDEAGSFGDWPEDFAEVALQTESRYLDAAEMMQMKN